MLQVLLVREREFKAKISLSAKIDEIVVCRVNDRKSITLFLRANELINT